MTRNLILILVAAIAAPALAACSGDKPPDAHRQAGILDGGLVVRPSALYLVGMDANADFRVELKELDAGTLAAFKAADTNNSGFLTPIELADWSEALAGDRYAPPGFIGFDTNGDQKITPDEFGETLSSLFKEYDRNGDGAVTRAEMVERLEHMRGRLRTRSAMVPGRSQQRR